MYQDSSRGPTNHIITKISILININLKILKKNNKTDNKTLSRKYKNLKSRSNISNLPNQSGNKCKLLCNNPLNNKKKREKENTYPKQKMLPKGQNIKNLPINNTAKKKHKLFIMLKSKDKNRLQKNKNRIKDKNTTKRKKQRRKKINL